MVSIAVGETVVWVAAVAASDGKAAVEVAAGAAADVVRTTTSMGSTDVRRAFRVEGSLMVTPSSLLTIRTFQD